MASSQTVGVWPDCDSRESDFGFNSRVLGLGGKWTAPGHRALQRHGLIRLPLERGLFVADIVRRPLGNVPHYAARRNALGRIAAVLEVLGRGADRPAKPFVETVVPASPNER